MLRLILVFLALYCGSAATGLAADPLHEVRKSFTIGGKPIPAEIFADFGDAWMSDSRPIVVTIDAKAAIDSNRYADPIKTNGRWVEQAKPGPGGLNGPETMAYEYRGATANGLLVLLGAWSGGGSGTFYYLHILDAVSNRAFDEDGSTFAPRPDPGAQETRAGRRIDLEFALLMDHELCARAAAPAPTPRRRRLRLAA